MDFDTPVSGFGRHTQRWDDMDPLRGVAGTDALPMFVADMEFRAAPCILDALRNEIEFGYMGYFGNPAPVAEAVSHWMETRHGWSFSPDCVQFTHGVVQGFARVIEMATEPGDGVILFTPVYHSFRKKIPAKGRTLVESPMVLRDGRYEMDLEGLAEVLTGREKVLTLISPHNPGGRIWSADELRAVADFCVAHDLILISDEIHMDLTFPGAKHIPTSVAAPHVKDRLITITAASKTFNIAGGETGLAIIEDAALLERFKAAQKAYGGTPNRFGMIMTKAAFTDGADWLDAAQAYIAENFRIWRERMNALPGVSVMDMQATYLTWVDFSGTGMSHDELLRRIQQDAKIAVSPGPDFGPDGEGYQRFNIAMSRGNLTRAADRLDAAFADLQ